MELSEFWNRMFSPSMDSGRGVGVGVGGVVAGTVLVPMRFVWPYGGRSVYLSGSFTRYIFHFFGGKALLFLFYYCATIYYYNCF